MRYIDQEEIKNKRVLLRVDYNVSLDKRHHIGNDERILQSLPTIKYLLKSNNTVILLSHLGRPHGKERSLSLEPVATRLHEFLPDVAVNFITDLESLPRENMRNSLLNQLFLLENLRFFPGEDSNDKNFAKQLATHGDVYVNDAFSVSHRKTASIIGLPMLLPSYAGLLMKKEVESISKATENPKHPFVAILGGAKISTKIALISKLIDIADVVLLGGGLANTFLLALNIQIGKSLVEPSEIANAKKLLKLAHDKKTKLLLPTDVMVGDKEGRHTTLKSVQSVLKHDQIFDIGPETQAIYGQAILQAKTIIWNGPVGYFETEAYRRGTDFIYYSIAAVSDVISIVGGGETIAAISNKDHLEKITHISTGGGAMLEFIENGTLPGIESLS